MERYLFVFGYESPNDARANLRGSDAESSNAVWVRAESEESAVEKGRKFAEEFVVRLYQSEMAQSSPSWIAGNFAHWIAKRPLEEFSSIALESLKEV